MTCTPPAFGPGATSRAVTSATATPDCASPLRLSRTSSVSEMKLSLRLLRTLCCAPSEPPCVGGISQRVWVPPGPLKEPRLSMSQMPVAARCWTVPNGLL